MRFESMRWLSIAVVGLLVAVSCGPPGPRRRVPRQPQPFGTWSLGQPAPGHLLATHAILLRNDKILVVGGSSYNCCHGWGKEEARLYDIASGTWGPSMPSPAPYGRTKDAFCGGHAHDHAGRVIFQGGLLGYGDLNGHGIENTARYDAATDTWTQLGPAAPHWYPTLVAGVKHMFNLPGRPQDIWKMEYGRSTWTSTGLQHVTKSTYPRAALLPNGLIFIGSPADTIGGQQDRKNYYYDPATNTLALAGSDLVPESGPNQHYGNVTWRSSAALLPLVPRNGDYPSVKFALFNGVNSYVKNLATSNPTWQVMGTRPAALGSPAPARHFANATLLPTGQVVVTGGVRVPNNDATAVLEPEIYDPGSNSWLLGEPASVPRNYHGVALLLPDGRIWTASGSQNESGSECGPKTICDEPQDGLPEMTEERVEIFTPWYYGRADRPVIGACPAKIATDGGRYQIRIRGSQGMQIDKVMLMRPGSVTHSFDTDQRLIELDVLGNTRSTVTVTAPYGAPAAPPGDYMVFALRSIASAGFKRWVPSEACWTRVEPQVARHGIPAAEYQTVFDGITSQAYRPVWVDGYEVAGQTRFNAIFTHADIPWAARHGMTGSEYQAEFNNWVGQQGYRLAQVDSYLEGGGVRYAAIWEKRPGPAWTAYHGVTQADHQARFDSLKAIGYRPVNISVVRVGATRLITALYDQAAVGTFVALAGMTEPQYQAEFNNQSNQGRRPVYVNAFMEGGVPKISAIWDETNAGAWVARHGLTAAGYQNEFDVRIGQGLQTRAVAGYETGGTSRFIALWAKK